jgi:hypothetical protein
VRGVGQRIEPRGDDRGRRGELVADAIKVEAVRVPTFAESIRDWCKRRKAAGVAMAATELGFAEHRLIPELGPMQVADIRKGSIKSALQTSRPRSSTSALRDQG